MLGVIVNCIAVILGSLIGLLIKRKIKEKYIDAIMIGIGLCVIYIGISGFKGDGDPIIAIIAISIGAIFGFWIDIDKQINRLGTFISGKFHHDNEKSIAEAFVSSSILFCIGAMTLVGSINAGLNNDNSLLFTKSALDFISSIVLVISLGWGVILSSVFILVFQGGIVLLSTLLRTFLDNNTMLLAQINLVGSILILALGLNIVCKTKIKVANYAFALVIVPFVYLLMQLIGYIA